MPLVPPPFRTIAAATCLALVTGAASAGALVGASLEIVVPGLPFGPVTFVATGAPGTSLSNLHATLGAGSAFAGTFTTSTIPTTAAPLISSIIRSVGSNDAASGR